MKAVLLASAVLAMFFYSIPAPAHADVVAHNVSGRITKPVHGGGAGQANLNLPQATLNHSLMARVVAIEPQQGIVTFRTDDGKYVSMLVTKPILRDVRIGMRARLSPDGTDGVTAQLATRR